MINLIYVTTMSLSHIYQYQCQNNLTEGVGKSSLVSTFVSRHFSELLPPIMTRVRIPPNAQLANCTSTIIDTQEGDSALTGALSLSGARLGSRGSLVSIQSTGSTDSISSWGKKVAEDTSNVPPASLLAAGSPYRNVDAIILVYDLERPETFDRLSSHWLPLIDKCYDGKLPVIVAGNKMDLQSPQLYASSTPENQQSIVSRQEIILLLKRFMFVRQCIKCSAKNLLNIDEVFKKAQQAVLYPINLLYDLSSGKLTSNCARALSRIFRIFDKDGDGFLSDSELIGFQKEVWGNNLTKRDVTNWKKVVVEHDSATRMDEEGRTEISSTPVLKDGQFTLQGFLTIFDVFISKNRLEVPWKVLRSCGYDDELNLVIPSSLLEGDDFGNVVASEWKLCAPEESFLTELFNQYDADKDGVLMPDETRAIFSVLRNPTPPWSDRGKDLFLGCPSMPYIRSEGTSPASSVLGVPFDTTLEMSPMPPSAPETRPDSPSMLSASGITISSSPLPSVDVSKDITPPSGALRFNPISYRNWMNHWQMICTVSPSICRVELFRLGYVNISDIHKQKERSFNRRTHCESHPLTIPTKVVTPSTLIRALVIGTDDSGSSVFIKKLHGETIMMDASRDYPETTCSSLSITSTKDIDAQKRLETSVHFIITHIPLGEDVVTSDQHKKLVHLLNKEAYDVALLVYNSSRNFSSVKQFEDRYLKKNSPKLFICTGTEQISIAEKHCQDTKIDRPLLAEIDKSKIDNVCLEYLVSFARRPRRRTSARKRLLWLGGLVSVGITVVIGLTIRRSKTTARDKTWFKCIVDLVSY